MSEKIISLPMTPSRMIFVLIKPGKTLGYVLAIKFIRLFSRSWPKHFEKSQFYPRFDYILL